MLLDCVNFNIHWLYFFLLSGFEPDLFRTGSADSHGKAHKSKKKKKEKKHKKHKKHKHEHKDKLDKLDKFIQEENLSSGSSNPPSPASPGSMGGSVSNSMASNMSFWAPVYISSVSQSSKKNQNIFTCKAIAEVQKSIVRMSFI